MNALEINKVSFEYSKETSVINNVSFTIPEKETTILIGPNGSGKTTLLKIMIGLLEPTSGTVLVYGKKPKDMRNIIGYVPQKLYFDTTFPITVLEFLNLPRNNSENKILNILESVGAKDIVSARLGELSGGQLQRVLIARSLLGNPKIIFLDEPVSGIDIGGEKNFYELIKSVQEKHDVTVVMVSHEVNIVSQIATQVICINKEMLCSGSPDTTLLPELIEELYGKEVSLYKHQCK
ncbi:MAG: zinc transport system ATP-binding protein [Candidatus Paceibacteria bacterium]|jgi:zinc transport system ATP-binding protein